MAQPGEYGDLLRALGRLVEGQGPRTVEITDHGPFLSLEWTGPSGAGQSSYQEVDLTQLREEARQLRLRADVTSRVGKAELLRTLGQELDREAFEFSVIREEDTGFRVSGTRGGRYANQIYSFPDIRKLSSARQGHRDHAG